MILKKLKKEFFNFAGSNLIERISRAFFGLIVAKWLGPEKWGVWYTLNILLQYGSMCHLGVLNGMNREVPFYRGRNESSKVGSIKSTSFYFLLFSSSFFVLMLISSAFIFDFGISSKLIFCLAFLLLTQQMYEYSRVKLKADLEFDIASNQHYAIGVLFPTTLFAASYLGLVGFILAQAFLYLVVGGFILIKDKEYLTFDFDIQLVKKLIKIGFPILLVGLLYSLFSTVDRWVIVSKLGTTSVGYYSLAVMALGSVSLLAMVIAQQVYPRMSGDWGKSNSVKKVNYWAIIQIKSALKVTLPISVAIIAFTPFLIRYFLPEYQEGITSVQILSIAPIFLAIGQGYANALNVVDKQKVYLVIIFASIIINLILNIYLISLGLGINGAAIATVLAYLFFGISLYIVGRKTLFSMS